MARGSQAKSEVMHQILDTFEGSFIYNDGKEVRIPLIENGEPIQIKVTLTAAKELVVKGADDKAPHTVEVQQGSFPVVQLTEQEIADTRSLIDKLNL